MSQVALVLALLIAGAVAVYAAAVPARHLARARRAGRIGQMAWFRLSPSGQAGDKHEMYGAADFRGVYTLGEAIAATFPYRTRGVATTVWLREGDGVTRLYVAISERHCGDGSPVRALASSLGARAERIEGAPPVPSGALVVAQRSRVMASFVKDVVKTKGAVADAVSKAMVLAAPGSTGALVVTFDMMRNSEGKRLEANVAEEALMRGGDSANYSPLAGEARLMVNKAVRVSIAAANSADDPALSRAILSAATSSISTLGWSTSTAAPGRQVVVRVAALAALGLAACSALGLALGAAVAPGAAVCALVLLAALARPDALAGRWYRAAIAAGEVVVPPFFYFSARYSIHARIRSSRSDGGDPNAKVGNRIAPPSGRQVLTLHGAAAFELLSFPDRLSIGVSSTDVLNRGIASTQLATEHPIFLGRSGTDQIIDLDLADLQYSFYTGGAPASGKTNMLQVIYAGVVWHGLHRTAGLDITPIWGETKGEGAYDAWATASLHPDAVMIDVHNPRVYRRTDFRLALEGPRLCDGAEVAEVVSNASRLVSGFQAAYGDGIKTSSRSILEASLIIALLLTPEEIAFVGLEGVVEAAKPNVIDLAFFVLGGDTSIQPQDSLLRLKAQLEDSEREVALDAAIGSISRFLSSATRGKLTEALSSPINKLIDLRAARLLWNPSASRRDTYIGDLVSRFAPVVINMGSYYDAARGEFSQSIERAIARRLLMVYNYLQWDHIKSHCNGWERAGRRVPVFYDETADIATSVVSDDVPNTLDEALKEARSRGNSYFLGCQSPAQLPEKVRLQVLGSRSKFWFQLHGQHDLDVAVYDLSSGDRATLPYSHGNVRGLPPGTSVGIMTRRGSVTSPFTLAVADIDVWRGALFESATVEAAVARYEQAKSESAPRPALAGASPGPDALESGVGLAAIEAGPGGI